MNNVNITKKLDSLTGLRGILAGLVVIVHAFLLLGWRSEFLLIDSTLKGLGHFGVSGFFILSGFILLYNYRSRKWQTKIFFVNRLARIYPLYLISILMALPIDVLSPNLNENNKITAFALTIGTLQSWFQFSVGRYNSPSWTISVESFFYLTFPLCLYLYNKSKKTFGLFTIIFAAMTCWNWKYYGHQFPANRLIEFLIGMWLFDVAQAKFVPSRGAAWLATLFILTGLCGHHLLGLSEYAHIWMLFFGSLVILSLAKADLCGNTVWGSPKWVLAGEISYGLYLLHAPIQRYVRQGYKFLTGEKIQDASLWIQIGYLITTSIMSLLMAYYVWKWIEVPARSYLRKRLS